MIPSSNKPQKRAHFQDETVSSSSSSREREKRKRARLDDETASSFSGSKRSRRSEEEEEADEDDPNSRMLDGGVAHQVGSKWRPLRTNTARKDVGDELGSRRLVGVLVPLDFDVHLLNGVDLRELSTSDGGIVSLKKKYECVKDAEMITKQYHVLAPSSSSGRVESLKLTESYSIIRTSPDTAVVEISSTVKSSSKKSKSSSSSLKSPSAQIRGERRDEPLVLRRGNPIAFNPIARQQKTQREIDGVKVNERAGGKHDDDNDDDDATETRKRVAAAKDEERALPSAKASDTVSKKPLKSKKK